MDEIGFLLTIGLLLLAIPVLGLVGFFRTLSLKRRVEELEGRLIAVEGRQGLTAPSPATEDTPPRPLPLDPLPLDPLATDPLATEAASADPAPVEALLPPGTLAGSGPELPEDHERPIAASNSSGDADPPPAAALPVSPPRSLEETIGTRWVVWVGGLALGLGGLFLVRFSIEQGWFGPGARIAFGALFALALAAAGEILRRRERAGGELPSFGQIPSAHIPSVLTAAATLTAFGTVYAAHALYDMTGAAPAFVLLGLVGLATLAAAALHGPILAGFGLVASYAAPALVSSGDPQPWPVVLYCVVVAGSAYGLARIRRWPWLAVATAGGAALWARLIMDLGTHDVEAASHLLLQSALAAVVLAIEPYRSAPDREARPDWLATAVLLVFAWLSCDLLAGRFLAGDLLAGRLPDGEFAGAGLGTAVFVFAGLEALVLTAAGVAAAPAAGAALAAGAVLVAALVGWPIRWLLGTEMPTAFPAPGSLPPIPDAIWLFLVFGSVAGAALSAATFLRLFRATGLPRLPAGLYAAAAVVTPIVLLVTAWWRVRGFNASVPFALVAALLGLAFVAAARSFKAILAHAGDRERLRILPTDGDLATQDADAATDAPSDTEGPAPGAPVAARLGMEAFAAGAIAALAVGLTMVLEEGALTVALALSALGAAFVTTREPMGLLRYAVGALGLAVAARLLWDPTVAGFDPGPMPIFNWLLWGYGVPALCFGYASVLLRRQSGPRADDQVVALCEALSIAFTGLLLAFELHHLVTGGRIWSIDITHLEVGLQATAALMMAVVLVSLEVTRRSLVIRIATYVFGGASLGFAVLGLLLVDNPLFNGSGEIVQGGAVLNSLLAAYLLPALAATVLAHRARGRRPAWFVRTARGLGFVLALAWLVLEIRRLFQGPLIGLGHRTGDAEFYTYSLAFLLVGLVLLAWGILRGSREARLASAAFILLAVVKAFLFDMAGLTGAFRALSFIGLGLVLVGIGLVYQKLVFRPGPGTPPLRPSGPSGGQDGGTSGTPAGGETPAE